eukprot:TRINITY_DN2760_c0_g1_i1.p1 TRINITY_DN2760_c0_g1~~TRINITY_DN2760_c0_g1_i1.p1  ORF type:complete len:158 (-),score=25.67 TRINITY_DN2760_c0_g1_i1:23-496(-)
MKCLWPVMLALSSEACLAAADSTCSRQSEQDVRSAASEEDVEDAMREEIGAIQFHLLQTRWQPTRGSHLDLQGRAFAEDSKARSDSRTSFCTGDGSEWQNPGCVLTCEKEACVWMPGCNWQGHNSYGGWCTGGVSTCTFETSLPDCQRANCSWHTAR